MRNTILTKTRRVESRSVRGLCTVVALKSLLCSPVLLPFHYLSPRASSSRWLRRIVSCCSSS